MLKPLNRNKIALTVPELLAGTGDLPSLMGILNVTEDSFSDGGQYRCPERAVEKALALLDAGALVVDLGAESTRPGAQEIPADVQIGRLLPVIRGIFQRKSDALLSVDTRNASVARAILEEGVQIINDVSGFSFDPAMGEVIASYGACAVLMHMRGLPENMRQESFCRYEDVVADVASALEKIRDQALSCGIRKEKLLLDVGIGFAKTAGGDLELIRAARYLKERLQIPLLYGVSRKSFLKACIGECPAPERDFATMGVLCALAQSGVAMLRVHEVRGAAHALKSYMQCLRKVKDIETEK